MAPPTVVESLDVLIFSVRPWDSCGDQANKPWRGVIGSVGFAEAYWPGRATLVRRYRDFPIMMTIFRVAQRHRRDLPACGNSAPND